jgi:hypothetical protein
VCLENTFAEGPGEEDGGGLGGERFLEGPVARLVSFVGRGMDNREGAKGTMRG